MFMYFVSKMTCKFYGAQCVLCPTHFEYMFYIIQHKYTDRETINGSHISVNQFVGAKSYSLKVK